MSNLTSHNSGLVSTVACPVCGATGREASDGMASQRGEALQGLYYLRPATQAIGMTVEEFVDVAKTYRCTACGNFYCDPWFSPEISARLFNTLGADHLFAWGNFENWLHRRPPARTANEVLFDVITRRVGPLDSYAEYGCPFQGFLQLFRGFEAPPAERLRLFARSLKRPRDIRWSTITRLFNALQSAAARLTVLNLRVRGLAVVARNSLRGSRISGARGETPLLPKRRYLLTRDTSVGWGSNCVRFGASCRYFAQSVLGAEVLPFNEADRRGPAKFDLLGIFNSLDHATYPLEVIRQSVAIARHVLLVTHHASKAGKQHWYAFGDDFAAWLERSIEGISAVDLREEADGVRYDCNYILLSRRDGA